MRRCVRCVHREETVQVSAANSLYAMRIASFCKWPRCVSQAMLSNGKTDSGTLSSTGAVDFAYVKEKLEAGPDLSHIFLRYIL